MIMKPALARLLLASCLLALPVLAEEQKQPLTIAVFDFLPPEEGPRDIGGKVSSLVSADLSTDGRVLAVERAELDKALSEQELALSGTIAADTAARVGHLTGAKVLVTGRVIQAGKETILVAKIIGTETSRVFGAKVVVPPDGSLATAATDLATSIADVATKNGDALVAKVQPPEALAAQIRAALKAEKLPTISIHIPEQHFGRPVIDPAAQTELSLLLKECGFTLLEGDAAALPDLVLEGEAFSERGLQKGNLVSCKARVEVKLRRRANGEILAVDREVSHAVDLSEHIAAKAALQEAARRLAPRVIPKAGQ